MYMYILQDSSQQSFSLGNLAKSWLDLLIEVKTNIQAAQEKQKQNQVGSRIATDFPT